MNENLIEQNCKRCSNYKICQSSGCQIKKDIERLQEENKQLKQSLIDIREYINETCYAFNNDGSHCRLKDSEHSKRILQIIDKAIGDDDSENRN